MEIHLKKINTVKVKPIKVPKNDKPIKGIAITGDPDEEYVNILEIAPTSCGKTTTTGEILDQVITKKTKIVGFISTIYNDKNWIAIKEKFEGRGHEFTTYTSMFQDGKNIIGSYNAMFEAEAKKRLEKEKLKKFLPFNPDSYLFFDEDPAEKKERQKYRPIEWIFIFDDLGHELRSPEYEAFMKKARHYHVLTISSTQDLKDINPATRNQVRVWLMFKGLSEERLAAWYEGIKPLIKQDDFTTLYKAATKEKYCFLYLAPRQNDYRINFSDQFQIPEDALCD